MPLLPRTSVVQPLDQSIRHIALTKDQIAIVDVEDYERINENMWQAAWDASSNNFRAQRTVRLIGNKKICIGMSREIIDAPKGVVVDHKNRNPLDNRKDNLRICTYAQNNENRLARSDNRQGFKGVSKSKKKFMAYITHNGKGRYLGLYATPEEASEVYRKASIELHGEYSIFDY